MAGVGEAAAGQSTQMHAALDAGIAQVSNFQTVTFVKYVRMVLPLDGFIFWVRADLLVDRMLYSAYQFNAAALAQIPLTINAPLEIEASGDLHYSASNTQEETDSNVVNRVVFTAEDEIQDLNDIGPYVIYIAEIDGVRFSFSARGMLQSNAALYHYVGTAILGTVASQIIDRAPDLDSENVVVSNSLPIWLSFNNYEPLPFEAFGNTTPLFPSYLVPYGMTPPYGAVHVVPFETSAMASAPTLGSTLSHSQLAHDRVKITLYGLRNNTAQDFFDFVIQYMTNYDDLGLMNMPIVRDAKAGQVEFGTLAQKKEIEFEVSYLQSRTRDIARQSITAAFVQYLVQEFSPSP